MSNIKKDLLNQVVWGCRQLAEHKLTPWSSGNVSVFDNDIGFIYIKPSGVMPHELRGDMISVVDEHTSINVQGWKPSTDTETHIRLYQRNRGDVTSIVHTHSIYATAWAVAGRDIPCACTMMADEFGGPIRCTRYASIGSDDIADAVHETTQNFHAGHLPKAVLLGSHGVLTFGKCVEEAVKTAVLVEACAKTLLLARTMHPNLTPLMGTEIKKNYERYQNTYGQR